MQEVSINALQSDPKQNKTIVGCELVQLAWTVVSCSVKIIIRQE